MNRRTLFAAGVLWVLIVLYSNPLMFFATLWRTWSPPIDAQAVRDLAQTLPNDPNVIRDRVLSDLVVYEYNWYTYNVPWYFPTAAEVVRDRRGDCEGQAVLLASILEAKHIPYQLKMSFDHMWVDYQQKKPNAMENDDMAFARRDGRGLAVGLPKHFDLKQYIDIQLDARWYPMPTYRKVLLFVGLLLLAFGPRLWRVARRLRPHAPAYAS